MQTRLILAVATIATMFAAAIWRHTHPHARPWYLAQRPPGLWRGLLFDLESILVALVMGGVIVVCGAVDRIIHRSLRRLMRPPKQ